MAKDIRKRQIQHLKVKAEPTKNTTAGQYSTIIRWLQFEENFKLITGGAASKKSVIAGQKLTKKYGYQKLADYVNKQHDTTWSPIQAESRYNAYVKKYKIAKKQSMRTGFGLDEKDFSKGIKTIEEKLNSMCENFNEMDDLFGARENISPSVLTETKFIETSSDPDVVFVDAEYNAEIEELEDSIFAENEDDDYYDIDKDKQVEVRRKKTISNNPI